jgi:hypothetical protein
MPDLIPPAPDDDLATRSDAIEASLAALDVLAALGETVEDEWSYVTALADAGRARLRSAAGADPSSALAAERGAAVVVACAEVAAISDPHRAIDWLSTFPAVVELALGPHSAALGPVAAGAPAEG